MQIVHATYIGAAGTLHGQSGENPRALFPKKIFYHRPLTSNVYRTVSKVNIITLSGF
jgi:hypothetical protein